MKVRIPTCDPILHPGEYRRVIEVEISDNCPKCGGARGKPEVGYTYDGSIRIIVDIWENPCGHIDKYEDVWKEVKQAGMTR